MIDMHRRAIWYMKYHEGTSDNEEIDDIFYSLLSADLENCFNSMDQCAGLDLLARKVPNLYPLLYNMYAKRIRLVLPDGTVIYLCNGWIQGRISSGYTLALIQSEIEDEVKLRCIEIKKKYEIEGRSFYIDDNGQFAKNKFNLLYLRIYNKIAIKYGLNLKQSKNKLVIGKSLDVLYDKLMHDIEQINNIDLDCNKLDINDIKICENGNCEVLGVPFGEQQFIDNYVNDKTKEWVKIMKLIRKLPKVSHQMKLLTNFYNINKINYLIRNITFNGINNWSNKFDKMFISMYNEIVGENMTSINLIHSSLPSKRGGISMRSINSSNSAAFIAANNGVCNVLPSLLSQEMISKTNVFIKEVKELAIADFNNKVLDKYKISEQDQIVSQKELMRRIDNTNLTKLYETYDDRGKALLTTLSNKRADAFMTCNTSKNLGVDFCNLEYRILLKRRLNMDIIKVKDANCVLCNGQLDVKGDHGINCQHGHGRHGTHNSLSAAVMRICDEAGYACDLELNGLIGDNSKRPADAFVHHFYGDALQRCPRSLGNGRICPYLYCDLFLRELLRRSGLRSGFYHLFLGN